MVMLLFLACLSAAQLFQFQPASLRPAPGQFVMTGSAAAPLAAESFASPPRLVVRPSAEKASFPWALCAAVSTAAFAARAGSRSRRVPRSDALEAARRRHRRAPCMQMSSGGTVTYFSLQKGFGFIQPQDDGEELYFHVTGIVDDKVPQLGDICYFDTQYDERKGNYRAVNVAGGSGDVLYGINYTTRNEQIMAAATDERRFLGLLDIFSKNAVKLNIVNVATILFQGGKLRLGLPGHLVMYLEATLNAAQCSDSFKAREVGNALYGLQCMDDSEEVRLLLATLTPKVQQCTEELSAQNVGNALYGLQSMSDSTELRQLVAALTRRVLQCREELTSQNVGNALYGLKSMDDSREVRQLLAVLTQKVRQCTEELSAQAVGNALYGLQRMGDSTELRPLLAALTPKVQQCTEEMSLQNVGMALHGLQQKGDSKEVRQLLAALIPKVENCREEIDLSAINLALNGLKSMDDSKEVRRLEAALAPKVQQNSGSFEDKLQSFLQS